MRQRVIIRMFLVALAGLMSARAQPAEGFEVPVDLAKQSNVSISHQGEEHGGWSLDATVEYHAPVPRISVRGSYVTRQEFDPDSHMAYRIFDDADTMILAEGRRSDWVERDDGALRADFEIDIPQVLDDPTLTTLHIRFDAVVEYQFWYREKYPDMPFPEISISNIPARDHFEPGWTWVPRFLPAGFGARVPAQFEVGQFAGGRGSGFVPALDVNTVDGKVRVPSPRVQMREPLERQFRGWLPLDAHATGTVMVRPGLVWEDVRWYEANDWFPRRAVTFISPVVYTIGVVSLLGALGWGWGLIARIERAGIRRGVAVGWGLGAAWFTAQMLMSGFWLVAGLLVLVGVLARSKKGMDCPRTYFATWAFFVSMELYWARLESSVGTVSAGIWISVAVWALLLAPLLAIRRDWVRWAIALVVTLGWTGLTFASVIYFDFFQDYPSVENLVYAGQIGELGDSVVTLIKQHHVLPFLVWFLAATIAGVARVQRNTQIEKT